ncbi:MAG TPA: MFS transporter [Jatrophihabitans sp.]|uniref:MFS transporter n=1 Tax=Jatrophihabitans sp. TaxID=1932789 RepID=UPI002EFD1DCA
MSPRRRFYALLGADIGSTLGSQVSLVAIPWLVLTTTGSATDMGLVAAAEMIPYLLSGTLLTPMADRFGLRTSSIFCDIASALAFGCIAAFQNSGLAWLLVLVAVAGALRGVGDRTKHVLLRPAAEAAGYPTIRLTSLYEGLSRLATLLGAPLGGLLIVWFGARGAVWLDAVSFGCCALVVAIVVAAKPAGPDGGRPAAEPYLTALRGGFRYLREDRVLFSMLGVVVALNVFSTAATVVFIPVWAREILHSPQALGLALGAFAGGALLGTFVFTLLAERLPQYPAFVIGGLISCVPRLLVLGLSDNLLVVMAVSVLAGVGIASVNPILGAALFQRVPDVLQTRVMGLCTTVCFTGIPVGALTGGWAVTRFGLHDAALAAVVLCLAVLSGLLLGLRRVKLSLSERPA